MTVTLCIVAYNEDKYLNGILKDFTEQTYPHELIHVVFVDSMSTDKTRDILEAFAAETHGFASIRIFANPKKILSSGWNVILANSDTDVILRVDAHSHIPSEFVERNIEVLKSGENISGGVRPCLIENETPWKRVLLQVENSMFGSGINKSRRESDKRIYVNTMFHAAYRREVFDKVGKYNEFLFRTEDNEIHYRMRQAGYKLCFDPKIVSYQYARNSLGKMVKQKFDNGLGIGLTLGVCPGCISPFYLVPAAFVGGIIVTTILSLFGLWQFAALMWGLYLIFGVVNAVATAISDGWKPFQLLMPVLFLILHVSYGVGTLYGIIKLPFWLRKYRKLSEEEK